MDVDIDSGSKLFSSLPFFNWMARHPKLVARSCYTLLFLLALPNIAYHIFEVDRDDRYQTTLLPPETLPITARNLAFTAPQVLHNSTKTYDIFIHTPPLTYTAILTISDASGVIITPEQTLTVTLTDKSYNPSKFSYIPNQDTGWISGSATIKSTLSTPSGAHDLPPIILNKEGVIPSLIRRFTILGGENGSLAKGTFAVLLFLVAQLSYLSSYVQRREQIKKGIAYIKASLRDEEVDAAKAASEKIKQHYGSDMEIQDHEDLDDLLLDNSRHHLDKVMRMSHDVSEHLGWLLGKAPDLLSMERMQEILLEEHRKKINPKVRERVQEKHFEEFRKVSYNSPISLPLPPGIAVTGQRKDHGDALGFVLNLDSYIKEQESNPIVVVLGQDDDERAAAFEFLQREYLTIKPSPKIARICVRGSSNSLYERFEEALVMQLLELFLKEPKNMVGVRKWALLRHNQQRLLGALFQKYYVVFDSDPISRIKIDSEHHQRNFDDHKNSLLEVLQQASRRVFSDINTENITADLKSIVTDLGYSELAVFWNQTEPELSPDKILKFLNENINQRIFLWIEYTRDPGSLSRDICPIQIPNPWSQEQLIAFFKEYKEFLDPGIVDEMVAKRQEILAGVSNTSDIVHRLDPRAPASGAA
jgi:hypothetical protein